ncbi:MAG: acylphosphatase [Armatimonadota bacterium]
MRRLIAIVRGRVQGVGYRMFVLEHAYRLGLKGYVRNLPEGEVEVVAEGSEDALQTLLTYLHRGPFGAIVQEVETYWDEPTGEFDRFFIAR